MNDVVAALANAIGAQYVIDDPAAMAPYLTDWRGRYTGRAIAVVRPGSTQETADIVRICASANVPMVPQGGNTGLCGGATPLPDGGSVLVSMARMHRIRTVDAANNALVAEAGCTLAAVQQAAEGGDRLFPLSLASEGSCLVGGNISTNAGGVQVLRYGNMRDLVLGVEVVLPDGRVWNGLRSLRKDNTGYDLKQLFIGAEGTLGIVTAAALKLFPRPRARATAWVAVPDPRAAVDLLSLLRDRCGERATAFELVGRSALDLVLQHIPAMRAPLAGVHDWHVLVELADALDGEALDDMLERTIAAAIDSGLAVDAAVASSIAQAHALWALRENISEAQKIEGISIKHDISVPVSAIPDFLLQAQQALAAIWPDVRIVTFGHLGDGNLHYNLSKPGAVDNAEFVARTRDVNRIVHDLVGALNGSISAEHGIGQLKREENARYKSEVELDLMRAVKRALDPHGLMNPGKVI
ncbi:FAD-binding oxidoreductase [Aromatoleum petrolei]|uniref:FAD-binding protein n=1 Tax=Aromatoleum petrolei TaxID=76116 RepID=A0ABX1ML78_9RHOO|nr:FAD-binding oxidoreductase [Aromatoleum petrolei]NMF88730.1 FAD-binding protein [Aromatoleum petrolei]QTQ37846.1 FAD-dependent oxidoreductase [Aromatoleum petrolei]